MKLIIAVIQDRDEEAVLKALQERRLGVTELASTGGFLRKGNKTLLIGLPEERVDEVIALLHSECQKSVPASDETTQGSPPPRGGVAFVLRLATLPSTLIETDTPSPDE